MQLATVPLRYSWPRRYHVRTALAGSEVSGGRTRLCPRKQKDEGTS